MPHRSELGKWAWAGPVLGLLSLYLWHLGAGPLFDVDEGAFSEATRELVTSGDWGHTTLNGTDRFDKPILVYWLQALSLLVWGTNEWATRLPSAVCILAALLAVYRFARTEWGVSQARWSVWVLGSGLGLLSIGRAATADGLLNALLVLTSLSLWRFAARADRAALYQAYLWCGLGLLAKGPVAVVIPGGALVLWSLLSDRGRTAWQALWCPKGWLIAAGLALPWYFYALQRHGMAFVDGFFMRHNVERFTGTLEGHGGGVAYYLVVLPLLLLPWTPLLWPTVRHLRALWQQPLNRFLLLWVGFVLALFSASGTKLPHYMLYGVAPLALLMAQQLPMLGRSGQVGLWAVLGLQWALGWALPVALPLLAPHVKDPWVGPLFATAPPAGAWLGWGGAWVGVLLLVLGRLPLRFSIKFPLAVWGVGLFWVGAVTPWLGETLQGPFKNAALWAREHPHPVVQWRMHQPSFAYYRGTATPRQTPAPGEWALVKQHHLRDFPYPYTVVFEHRGLWLVQRQDRQP